MNKLNLSINDIQSKIIKQIKITINNYDNQLQMQGMVNKSTLKFYQENKDSVHEEKWFRNS